MMTLEEVDKNNFIKEYKIEFSNTYIIFYQVDFRIKKELLSAESLEEAYLLASSKYSSIKGVVELDLISKDIQ